MKPQNFNLVKIENVTVGSPWMFPGAAEAFNQLRAETQEKAGFDFLRILGDIWRSPAYKSSKPGVANRSWHKTGRAFDFNQGDVRLVLVKEPRNGKMYFRTYLRCIAQDGTQGEHQKALFDFRGGTLSGYYFDFTKAAEKYGFERIPAWNGWERNPLVREFWHYQWNPLNLTWEQAMTEMKSGKPIDVVRPSENQTTLIVGLNDRGTAVRKIQDQLVALDELPAKEADGVFGAKSQAAVISFQRKNGLVADGIVGQATRLKLQEKYVAARKV